MATANQHFHARPFCRWFAEVERNRGNGPDRHPRQYVLAEWKCRRNAGMIGERIFRQAKNIVIACAARALPRPRKRRLISPRP